MLVLSRKLNERVIIQVPDGSACTIEIVVSGFQPGQVKLSFLAPRNVQIDREEVAMRIAGKWPNATQEAVAEAMEVAARQIGGPK